ncbi:MAG: hypothetical protein C4346_00585 [Chloroflexota bacterium]
MAMPVKADVPRPCSTVGQARRDGLGLVRRGDCAGRSAGVRSEGSLRARLGLGDHPSGCADAEVHRGLTADG